MDKKFVVILSFSILFSSCSSFFQLINISPSSRLKEISHTSETPNTLYTFFYADTTANEYLRELRNQYIAELPVNGQQKELDKILEVLD